MFHNTDVDKVCMNVVESSRQPLRNIAVSWFFVVVDRNVSASELTLTSVMMLETIWWLTE